MTKPENIPEKETVRSVYILFQIGELKEKIKKMKGYYKWESFHSIEMDGSLDELEKELAYWEEEQKKVKWVPPVSDYDSETCDMFEGCY